jgi:hypothetical protein
MKAAVLGQAPPMLVVVLAEHEAHRLNVPTTAERREDGVDLCARVVGDDDELGGSKGLECVEPAEDRLAQTAAFPWGQEGSSHRSARALSTRGERARTRCSDGRPG